MRSKSYDHAVKEIERRFARLELDDWTAEAIEYVAWIRWELGAADAIPQFTSGLSATQRAVLNLMEKRGQITISLAAEHEDDLVILIERPVPKK